MEDNTIKLPKVSKERLVLFADQVKVNPELSDDELLSRFPEFESLQGLQLAFDYANTYETKKDEADVLFQKEFPSLKKKDSTKPSNQSTGTSKQEKLQFGFETAPQALDSMPKLPEIKLTDANPEEISDIVKKTNEDSGDNPADMLLANQALKNNLASIPATSINENYKIALGNVSARMTSQRPLIEKTKVDYENGLKEFETIKAQIDAEIQGKQIQIASILEQEKKALTDMNGKVPIDQYNQLVNQFNQKAKAMNADFEKFAKEKYAPLNERKAALDKQNTSLMSLVDNYNGDVAKMAILEKGLAGTTTKNDAVWTDYWKKSGSLMLSSMIASAPVFAYRLAAIGNVMSQGYPVEQAMDMVDEQIKSNPVLNRLSIASTELSNKFQKAKQELAAKEGISFSEALEKKDYMKAAELAFKNGLESAPLSLALAATVFTGGASALSVSSMAPGAVFTFFGAAGTQYASLKSDPTKSHMTEEQLLLNSIGNGSFEAIFEFVPDYLGGEYVKGLISKYGKQGAAKALKSAMNSSFVEWWKKYFLLTQPVGEGFGEVLTGISQRMVDIETDDKLSKMTKEQKKEYIFGKNYMTSIEEFSSGAAGSSIFIGTGAATKTVLTAGKYANKIKIDDLLKRKAKIDADIFSGQMSPEAAEVAFEESEKIKAEVSDIVEKEQAAFNAMTPDEQVQVQKNLNEIEVIDNNVKSGAAISEETVAALDSKKQELEKQTDEIVSNAEKNIKSIDEILAESMVPDEEEIKSFAERLAKGENLESPEDIQFYQNNSQDIEKALKDIKSTSEQIAPIPSDLDENHRVPETMEEVQDALINGLRVFVWDEQDETPMEVTTQVSHLPEQYLIYTGKEGEVKPEDENLDKAKEQLPAKENIPSEKTREASLEELSDNSPLFKSNVDRLLSAVNLGREKDPFKVTSFKVVGNGLILIEAQNKLGKVYNLVDEVGTIPEGMSSNFRNGEHIQSDIDEFNKKQPEAQNAKPEEDFEYKALMRTQNPNGGESIYYKGKFVGRLTNKEFEQSSGNKDQIFDSDLMSKILDTIGIKHDKPKTSSDGKQNHISIKVNRPIDDEEVSTLKGIMEDLEGKSVTKSKVVKLLDQGSGDLEGVINLLENNPSSYKNANALANKIRKHLGIEKPVRFDVDLAKNIQNVTTTFNKLENGDEFYIVKHKALTEKGWEDVLLYKKSSGNKAKIGKEVYDFDPSDLVIKASDIDTDASVSPEITFMLAKATSLVGGFGNKSFASELPKGIQKYYWEISDKIAETYKPGDELPKGWEVAAISNNDEGHKAIRAVKITPDAFEHDYSPKVGTVKEEYGFPLKSEEVKKSKLEEVDEEIKKELEKLLEMKKGKLSSGVDPEQLAQALKITGLFIKKGVLKFEDLVRQAAALLGDSIGDIMAELKAGYLAYQAQASEEELAEMSSIQEVRKFNLENNETETEPKGDEVIEESETRALLDEAEAAESPEEIEAALDKIEAQIEKVEARIINLTTNFSTEGIEHELPNIEIGKKAKKEVNKYAKEVARILGWDLGKVYPNIAPAGGEVTFELLIPNTPLRMWVAVKYEPKYIGKYGEYLDYKLEQFFYRIENPSAKGSDRYVGNNQYIEIEEDVPTPKEVAQIFGKEAAPYIDKINLTNTDNEQQTRNVPNQANRGTSSVNTERNAGGPETGTEQASVGTGQGENGESSEIIPDVSGDVRETVENANKSGGSRSSEGVIQPERLDSSVQQNFAYPPGFERNKNKTFSAKQAYSDNIAAAQVLLSLLKDPGTFANDEQKTILSKYNGMGPLGEILFDLENVESWPKSSQQYVEDVRELRNLIDQIAELTGSDPLAMIKASTLNAYYTDVNIIRTIWDSIFEGGFTGGRVLEGAVGSGRFIGAMPSALRNTTKVTGVEMETLSSLVAKYLYPQSKIINSRFEKASLPSERFDLFISNVPFGRNPIYDASISKKGAEWNAAMNRVHNYYMAKSLDMVRPGGTIVVINTSNFFDTPANEHVRALLAKNSEFLGGVRLPSSAFKKDAGTQVVTDILVFRKNLPNEQSNPNQSFVKSTNKLIPGEKGDVTVPINNYFQENPKNVLGEYMGGGMYSADEGYSLEGELDYNELGKALVKITKSNELQKEFEEAKEDIKTTLQIGKYGRMVAGGIVSHNGNFYYVKDFNPTSGEVSLEEAPKVPAKDTPILKSFIDAKNVYFDILNKDESGEDASAEREKLKGFLLELPNDIHGAPNSRKPIYRVISGDPDFYAITALINKDGSFADIVNGKISEEAKGIEYTDDAADAVNYSINTTGRLDVPLLSKILRLEGQALIDKLGDLVFETPDGEIIERAVYLSGNVREKLKIANEWAQVDTKFNKNVEELTKVIPPDLSIDDITVQLGANWIPIKYVNAFMDQVFGPGQVKVAYAEKSDLWFIDSQVVGGEYMASGNGEDRQADVVIKAALTKNVTDFYKTVRDEYGKEMKILLPDLTASVRDKAGQLSEQFQELIKADPVFSVELARIYNDLRNGINLRFYDGSKLTFPGMQGYSLDPHQKDAVMMISQNMGGMIDHIVGAGKTLVMAVSAIKMKQMGLIKKPMVTTMKSVVPGFLQQVKMQYPNAKVLAPKDKDFTPANRQNLYARIAANDWDLIIISHEDLGKIPLPPEFEENFINEAILELTSAMSELKKLEGEGASQTKKELKAIQDKIEKLRERISQIQDKGDFGSKTDFGTMGIDFLMVDESQQFKNLDFITKKRNVSGLGTPKGSKRAFNLKMVSRYIQEMHGGDKGLVLASGTPISNSLVELYNIFQYLRPSLLKSSGMLTLDQFLSNFVNIETVATPNVAGVLKLKSRVNGFSNVAELAKMYMEVSDIRAEHNLKIERPDIEGGKPQLVMVEPQGIQDQIIKAIFEASNTKSLAPLEELGVQFQGDAESAIGLVLTTLGKKNSIDPRLIFPDLAKVDTKLDAMTDNIARIYQESSDLKGTQLVFSDIGTPKTGKTLGARIKEVMEDMYDENWLEEFSKRDEVFKTKDEVSAIIALQEVFEMEEGTAKRIVAEAADANPFSVYGEIKNQLIAKGIPENEIAFIHSYPSKDAKAKLFQQVNDGEIRVLIGSTGKLGTGVNVQKRVRAMHHVEMQWRPSDFEQRNGRGIRRGNIFKEVAIYVYATVGSLDAYILNTVSNKQKGIESFRSGAQGMREMSFEDGESITLSEMAAAISGDDRLVQLEKAKIEQRKIFNRLVSVDRANRLTEERIAKAENSLIYLSQKIKNQSEIAEAFKGISQKEIDVPTKDSNGNAILKKDGTPQTAKLKIWDGVTATLKGVEYDLGNYQSRETFYKKMSEIITDLNGRAARYDSKYSEDFTMNGLEGKIEALSYNSSTARSASSAVILNGEYVISSSSGAEGSIKSSFSQFFDSAKSRAEITKGEEAKAKETLENLKSSPLVTKKPEDIEKNETLKSRIKSIEKSLEKDSSRPGNSASEKREAEIRDNLVEALADVFVSIGAVDDVILSNNFDEETEGADLQNEDFRRLKEAYKSNYSTMGALNMYGYTNEASGLFTVKLKLDEMLKKAGLSDVYATEWTNGTKYQYGKQQAGAGQVLHIISKKTGKHVNPNAGIKYLTTEDGEVYGMFKDNKIYINTSKISPETPIHEFGHLFTHILAQYRPDILERGLELIGSEEGRLYMEEVENNPAYEFSDRKEEALVRAIADKGARIATSTKARVFFDWIKEFWSAIKEFLGFDKITPEQLENMTLENFVDSALRTMFSKESLENIISGRSVEPFIGAKYNIHNIYKVPAKVWNEAMNVGKKFGSDVWDRMQAINAMADYIRSQIPGWEYENKFRTDFSKQLGVTKSQRRVSKLSTILNDPSLNPEIKSFLSADVFEYESLPMQVTASEAEKIISTLGVDEAERAVLDYKNGMHEATRTMLASGVIRSLQRMGETRRAASFFENYSSRAQELGQAINAFKAFSAFDAPGLIAWTNKKRAEYKMEMLHSHEAKIQRLISDLRGLNEEAIEQVLNNLAGKIEATQKIEVRPSRKSPEYGSKNRIVTREEYEKAKAALRGKFFTGLPVELITMAAWHVEAAGRSFADYTSSLIAETSGKIRPYLKELYIKGRNKLIEEGADAEEFLTDEEVEQAIGIEQAIQYAKKLGEAIDAGHKVIADKYMEKLQDVAKKYGLWDRYRDFAVARLASMNKKDIEGYVKSTPMLQEFADYMIANLGQKVREELGIEKATPPQKAALEVLADAFRNIEKYQEVWDQVRDILIARYADNPEALDVLDRTLGPVLDKPFNDKLMGRAIKEGLNEFAMTINDIVRLHYSAQQNIKMSLAQKLVERAGLNGEEAESLSKAIQNEFDKLVTEKKAKLLKKMINPTNQKNTKGLEDELIKLSNLGAFTDEEFREAYAEKMGWATFTEAQSKEIERLAEAVQNANTDQKKFRATEDFLKYQASLAGTSWTDVALGIWYANILSGYTTQEVNLGQNAVNATAVWANSMIQAIATGKVDKGYLISKGLLSGLETGLIEAYETMRTGYSPIRGKVETPAILERVKFWGGGYNPANWLKFVRRFMVASDVLFFEGLKEMRASQFAYSLAAKEGKLSPTDSIYNKALEILNRTSDSLDDARIQANKEYEDDLELINSMELSKSEKEALINQAKSDKLRRIASIIEANRPMDVVSASARLAARGTYNYRPEGFLGVISDAVNKAKGTVANKAKNSKGVYRAGWMTSNVLMNFAVPFTNIVSNVFNETIQYSPMAAFYYGSIDSNKELNEMEKDQMKVDLTIKAAIGTSIMLAMYLLSAGGGDDEDDDFQITANGTGDYKKNYILKEGKKGWQPFSIRIGDRWISYQYTPFFFPMAIIGNMSDYNRYRGVQATDTWWQSELAWSLKQIVPQMFNTTFLTGLSKFLDAVSSEDDKAIDEAIKQTEKAAKSFVVPNLYTQLFSKYQDIGKVPEKQISAMDFLGQILQDMPVARNRYNDKINVLGDPVYPITDKWTMSPKENVSPVWDLLISKKAYISSPVQGKSTVIEMVNGIPQERRMTDNEFYNYAKTRGQLMKKWLEQNYEGLKPLPAEDYYTKNAGKVRGARYFIKNAWEKSGEIAKSSVIYGINKQEVENYLKMP